MKPGRSRRQFLAALAAGAGASVGAGALLRVPSAFAAMAAQAIADIRIGITVDTRPDWNGPQNFMRSIIEASQVGYRNIETFWNYVRRWEDNPQELKEILLALGLRMVTVSNSGGPGGQNANFADPSQHAQAIEDHMNLVKFIHYFDCDHLKINTGRRPEGGHTTQTYRAMANAFDELGKRMLNETGIKLGVHQHLDSMFEVREDIDAVMELTNPDYVWFVHDTHQVTMGGMDPVEMTRIYGSRTVEFHLKDAPPEYRGGKKDGLPSSPGGESPSLRHTFELGHGGVDFPEILFLLNRHRWNGWWTVELNWTQTSAKHSATVSKNYLEEVLSLRL